MSLQFPEKDGSLSWPHSYRVLQKSVCTGELLTKTKPSPSLSCVLSQCQQRRSGSELCLSVEKQPSQSFHSMLWSISGPS